MWNRTSSGFLASDRITCAKSNYLMSLIKITLLTLKWITDP